VIGLHQTFQLIVLDVKTRVTIVQQLKKFKRATVLFGMDMAIDTRNKKNLITKLLSFNNII